MEKCVLCGEPTFGSIGRAGIRWKNVCQPCKDKEDDELLQKIRKQKEIIGKVFEWVNK